MLDKIKDILSKIKDYAIYVIAPLLGLLGYIAYLLSKNRTLTDTVRQVTVEKELGSVLEKKGETENEANKAVGDYESVRDEYISEHKSDS